MSQGNLRLLRSSDLSGAMELSRAAGWNQTIEDWEMLLRLDPQSCFAVELNDRIVATTTLLCYGQELAWIGMVLTRQEYQRMGFARRLMQTALDRAAELKIECIKLDATSQGQPLYEKLGFQTEQIIERWFCEQPKNNKHARPALSHIPPSSGLDRTAFGADRTRVFAELETRSIPATTAEAYCFSRNGTRFRYLGPCVATEPQAARVVIEQTLRSSTPSGWCWDLLSSNKMAVELAGELGFTPQRRLERMSLGKRFDKNDQMVYAIAGFELG
jgi:GNAT superfamily N-acetyltransferase